MYKICPACGAIAEYNAYYGRVTCTRCNWESEKISRDDTKFLYFFDSNNEEILDEENTILLKGNN